MHIFFQKMVGKSGMDTVVTVLIMGKKKKQAQCLSAEE